MLIGADVEGFIVGPRNNFIPACGKLGGTKGNAIDIGEGFSVQEDNVCVEFNIPPVSTGQELTTTLGRAKERVLEYVRDRLKDRTVDIRYHDAVQFSSEALTVEGAQTFGCSPEHNPYEQGNPYPTPRLDGEYANMRFAGLHLHFGFPQGEFNVPGWVASTLLEALLLVDEPNLPLTEYAGFGGSIRQQYYGRAGAYRDTTYPGGYSGFEYRRIGSAMMGHLGLVQEGVNKVSTSLARLCNDRDAAAALYRALDLRALRSRTYHQGNVDAVRKAVRGA